METPVLCAARLIGSLEELIEQEGMYLRGGSFALVAEIRRRTDPIVRRLVELSAFPGVSDLRDQVAGVLALSARHSILLQEKMEEMGAEIRRTDQARYRTAQFGPAYLNPTETVVPRFLATG